MPNWLRARVSSLGFRLLFPLFVAIGAVLVVYAVLSFRSVEENFLSFVGGEAERSSELIRRATHDGMLLHRLDDVQAVLERVAEGPELAVVRVYDKQGTVVLSSDSTEVGHRTESDAGRCGSCHPAGDPAGASQEAAALIHVGNQEVLRHVSVIQNEAACASGGCHEQAVGKPVLGVLEVEMSLVPLAQRLASERRQLIWATLALLLVIGAVTAFIFRRLIYRPIGLLQAGARQIADGDLSTRIRVPGQHELASLAGAFNRMAEDLDRMQEELKEWSRTLEQKVVQKTSELRAAQGQVLHMEKMASLGKLSATVAHELNNPISGILTYSRLIERDLTDQPLEASARQEMERYLHLVQQESVRCGTIVQNLMAFARRTSTDPQPVDVNEVVDRSIMLIRHHLEISGITLNSVPLEGDTVIVADEGQLEQAFVALFVNAVEAMPDGGELGVRVTGNPRQVEIHVTDTGIGMPPDVLDHVFEPFFSTKTQESGAGLGMSVVYGIIHRHGGTIEIQSEPGEGTDIRVRLLRHPPPSDGTEEDPAIDGKLAASVAEA
jgi:two-component system NtrC family sensor kinase